MRIYISPNFTFLDDWIGLDLSVLWGENDTMKFISFNFAIINLFMVISFGVKKND